MEKYEDRQEYLQTVYCRAGGGTGSGPWLYGTDLHRHAAALTAGCLGGMPDHLVVESSGNIIKNVKGAVVPNSGGLKGIEAAAVLGRLEVIRN